MKETNKAMYPWLHGDGCFFFFLYYFNLYSLQSFAIPGSISLSILSGFLFPFWLALLLVCFVSLLTIVNSFTYAYANNILSISRVFVFFEG